MKNIFLVINKEKIYAYVVSVLTIVTVFFLSSIMSTDFEETEETSANIVENIVEQNIIDNTKTETNAN